MRFTVWGLLVFLLVLPIGYAATPTQQYSKLYLNPFYLNAMTNNLNYNWSVNIDPPDGLSSVINAMITFQVYITPTVSFNLLVNGQACTPPTFQVHTTYMDAGYAIISYDCSNVINKKGNYSLRLTPTGANTGAIYGWLDLTYKNNPPGTLTLMGTEYTAGDEATVFLQLKDNYGNYVNNGSCYVDLWYPKNGSGIHPYVIQNAPMLKAPGNKGLYYYDMMVPEILGIYMLGSTCYYTYNYQWIYPEDEQVYSPRAQLLAGSVLIGTSLSLNSFQDNQYMRCDATAGAACQFNLTYNISQYGAISNLSTMNVYFSGQSDVAGKVVTFAYYNGTTFVNLPNTWTTVATGSTATLPGSTDQLTSNVLPLSAVRTVAGDQIVTIRVTTPTGLARYYANWATLAALSTGGTPQDLKGSNEIHVSEYNKDINRFFSIDSCNGYIDGRCGIFTNDGNYSLMEGEIDDFVNITASQSKTNAEIIYSTPDGVDCSALYEIQEYTGSWTSFSDYYVTAEGEKCIIHMTKSITSGEQYQFWLRFDNYLKWEVEYTKEIADTIFTAVDSVCLPLNFSYDVPIEDTTVLSSDPLTRFCHYTYDDGYYFYTLYNNSLLVENSGEYGSYVQESSFYRQELYERLELIKAFNGGDNSQLLAILTQINSSTANINDYLQNNISVGISGLSTSLTSVLANQSFSYAKLLDIQADIAVNYQNLLLISQLVQNTNSTLYGQFAGINSQLIIMNNTLTLIQSQNSNQIIPALARLESNMTLAQQKLDNIYLGLGNISIGEVTVDVNFSEVYAGLNIINQTIISLRTNMTDEFALAAAKANNIHDEVERIEWKLDCNNTVNIICDDLAELRTIIIGVNDTVNANAMNSSMLTAIYDLALATNLTVNGIQSYLSSTIYPAVDGVEADLTYILANQSVIHASILDVQSEITAQAQTLSLISLMIQNTNSTLHQDITSVSSQLTILNNTINLLSSDISDIHAETAGLASNISYIQAQISSIPTYNDTDLRNRLVYINDSLNMFAGNTSASLLSMSGGINDIMQQVNYIEWKLDCNNTINIVCDKLDAMQASIISVNNTILASAVDPAQLQAIYDMTLATNLTVNGIQTYLSSTIYPAVDGVEADLTYVLANQSVIHASIIDVQSDIAAQAQTLSLISLMIQNTNSTLHQDIALLDGQLTIINNTLNLLSSDISDIHAETTGLAGNISYIQSQISAIPVYDDTDLRNRLIYINNSLNMFAGNTSASLLSMSGGINDIMQQVNYIEWKLDCNNTVNIICDKLDAIQASISSVNDTILASAVDPAQLQAIYDMTLATNLTVNGIQSYLSSTIYPAVDNIETQLISVNMTVMDTFLQLNNSIQQVGTRLDVIESMIINVNDTMQANCLDLQQRLDLMNATLVYLQSDILDIQAGIAGLQGNMSILQSDIGTVYMAVDTLEAGQQDIISNITELRSEIYNVQAQLTSVNSSLQGRFDSIELSLSSLHDKTDAIEWKLDCNNTINIMCDYLATLDAHIISTNATAVAIQQYLQNTVTPELTAIQQAIISTNMTVLGVQQYLNTTLFPMINQTEQNTQLLLVNTTNIWDGITQLKSNLTSQSAQISYLEFLMLSMNQSMQANQADLIIEINQNEAKLDQLNYTATLIYNEILNNVIPTLNGVQGNLTIMQGQLNSVQSSLDYQNATQLQILSNLSNIYQAIGAISFNTSSLQADIYALNASIQGRFNSTDLQLQSIQTEVNHIEWKLDCNNTINVMCDKLDSIYNLTLEINDSYANISAYLYGPITLYLNQINSTTSFTYTLLVQMNQTLDLIYDFLFGTNTTYPPSITIYAPISSYSKYSPFLALNASISSTSGFALNHSIAYLYDSNNSLVWSNDSGYIGSMTYDFIDAIPAYNLSPGTYTFAVTATDLDNRYAYSAKQVRINNSAPTGTLFSPDGGMYVNSIQILFGNIADEDADDLTATLQYSSGSSWTDIAQLQYPLIEVNNTCALTTPTPLAGNFTPNISMNLNRMHLVLNQTGQYSITLFENGTPIASSKVAHCIQDMVCLFRFSNAALSSSTYTWNTSDSVGSYACNTSHPWLAGPSEAWQELAYTPNNSSVLWNITSVQPWLYYDIRLLVSDGTDQAIDTTDHKVRVLSPYANNGSTSSSGTNAYMYCNLETNECFTKEQIEGRSLAGPTGGVVLGILPVEQTEAVKTMVLGASSYFGVPWWLFIILVAVIFVILYGLWTKKRQVTYG